MDRAIILRTERLAVTTWVPDDLDDLNRLHSDPVTMTFIGGRPETREESSARLAQYLDEEATRGWTKWRVQDTQGQLVGRGGFGEYANDRELGYTIDRALWGAGLATELAGALTNWHVANPHPRRSNSSQAMSLWAYAAIDNVASIRVMTKVGLDFVESRQHEGRPYAFFKLVDSTHPPHDSVA